MTRPSNAKLGIGARGAHETPTYMRRLDLLPITDAGARQIAEIVSKCAQRGPISRAATLGEMHLRGRAEAELLNDTSTCATDSISRKPSPTSTNKATRPHNAQKSNGQPDAPSTPQKSFSHLNRPNAWSVGSAPLSVGAVLRRFGEASGTPPRDFLVVTNIGRNWALKARIFTRAPETLKARSLASWCAKGFGPELGRARTQNRQRSGPRVGRARLLDRCPAENTQSRPPRGT